MDFEFSEANMIIFLCGQDTYRSKQKLNEIAEHYQKIHKSGLSLICFEKEDLNFQDFKNVLDSSSIFKEKKLIILKEIFSNPTFKEEFLKEKESLAKTGDIILIYEKKTIQAKDSLFRFLKKNSELQEFEFLEGEQLKDWIKKEFLKYKTRIEPQALEKLIEFVGNDLWQMANEIKKLVSYKSGQKIKKEEVELLVRPKIETDIFKTVDAIASKNKKRALELLRAHLRKGDHPLYLLSMINFQFRNLLMVRSHQLRAKEISPRLSYRANMLISERLGIHPYIVIKTIQQARKFNLEELKRIYQKIFQLDLDIKRGKINSEVALDLLIAEI